jgi:hypothetical protein
MAKTVLLALLAVTLIGAQPRGSQVGWIHGRIVALNGAVIPGVSVKLSSPVDQCETAANVEGKFHCQVSPGRYTISAAGIAILPYRRASVEVRIGEHKFITLSTVPPPPSDQNSIGPVPLKYESILAGANGADLLIRFETSEKQARGTTFRGKYLMLSLDDLAIYASGITCSVSLQSCRAEGNVTVEIGHETLEGNQAELDIQNRTVKVTRDPVVVRKF